QGRIIKQDIESYLAKQNSLPGQNRDQNIQSTGNRNTNVSIPLSSVRKVIAKRTVESIHTIPQFHVTMHADMTEFLNLHDKVQSISSKADPNEQRHISLNS